MPKSRKPHLVSFGSVRLPIYETPSKGRSRFTLVWYEHGIRNRKVFDDLTTAKAKGGEVATKLANGSFAALKLTPADHESYIRAMKALEPFGLPLHAAIEEFALAKKELPAGVTLAVAAADYAGRHGKKLTVVSVRDAVAAFVASKSQERLNKYYVRLLKRSLERFAAAFQTNIAAVHSQDIQKWIRDRGGAPKTQNHLRADLVALGRYSRDYLKALPKGATEFEAVKRLKEPDTEIGTLSPESMSALLAAAVEAGREESLLYFLLGGFAGLRPFETMRLHWEEVDVARGYVRVTSEKSKTARKRLVPMPENLRAWLATRAKADGELFSEKADERAKYFAAVAGFSIPKDGLRHSYGTYRMALTNDSGRVSGEMGNSPVVVVKHYDRLAMKSEGEAWFAIAPKDEGKIVPITKAA